MKYIKYLFIGIFFGIVLYKGEVISWFRIQEMFRFQSIHMYGIIGIGVAMGVISVLLIKKFNIKAIDGSTINLTTKPYRISNFIGGTLFGLGWALTGACPGPIYALVGSGQSVYVLVLLSALLGAFTYGMLKPKLPH